jgi:hypothetical protein
MIGSLPAQHPRQLPPGPSLAVGLLITIAVTVVAMFVSRVGYAVPVTELDTLMKIVFAPLVTILGTALGFYYGSSERPR